MSKGRYIESRQFTVRPKPKKDENLIGYMTRLLHENGFVSRRDTIARLFGQPLLKIPFEFDSVRLIAAASGPYGKRLKSLFADPIKVVPENFDGKYYVRYLNLVWNRQTLNFGTPRFCVECMKVGEPYYRFLWDFRLLQRCPEHGCILTKRCWSCKAEFNWSTWDDFLKNKFTCKCGICVLNKSIKKVQAQKSAVGPKERLASARFFAGLIAPKTYPKWAPVIDGQFRSIPTEDVIALVQYLGSLAEMTNAPLRGRFSPTNGDYVETRFALGVKTLLNWPASFHSLLEVLTKKNVGRRHDAPISVFGNYVAPEVLSTLGKAEGIVSAELEQFMRSPFFKENVTAVSFPVRGTHIRPKGMMSSAEALRDLSLSASSLRCLLKTSKREGVKHFLEGGQWWFCEEQIQTVIKRYRLFVSRHELELVLGFDGEDMSEIKHSFHMPLIMRPFNGAHGYVVDADAYNRMLGKAAIMPRGSYMQSPYVQGMEAVRVFRERGLTSADLVDAIFDNLLPVTRISYARRIDRRFHFALEDLKFSAERLGTRAHRDPTTRND